MAHDWWDKNFLLFRRQLWYLFNVTTMIPIVPTLSNTAWSTTGRVPCGSKVKHSCMHSKNRIVINRFLFRIIKLSPINQIKNRRKAKIQKIFWWVRVTNDHMCCSCNGLIVCSGKNFLSELLNIPFQGNKNAPWPGIEPGPPEWESGILTPRPSGTWCLCS